VLIIKFSVVLGFSSLVKTIEIFKVDFQNLVYSWRTRYYGISLFYL